MNRIKNIVEECIICTGDFEILRTTEPCEACKKKYLSAGVYIIETKEIERNGKPRSAEHGSTESEPLQY